LLTRNTALLSLRAIRIDLRPYLPDPIIAHERENLEELMDNALSTDDSAFHDTLGLHAWPSGFIAAMKSLELIQIRSSATNNPTKVLELGCGIGLPSLAAYLSGNANVVATDLDVELAAHSFAVNKANATTSFQCLKLDLLDAKSCENLIIKEKPDLIVAADCLYDASLAKAVGRTMGVAVSKNAACQVLVADPGRLKGLGRSLFMESFYQHVENPEESGFIEVEAPQDTMRKAGASLSFCGVQETKVGLFTFPSN